jgi:hypothetical protein
MLSSRISACRIYSAVSTRVLQPQQSSARTHLTRSIATSVSPVRYTSFVQQRPTLNTSLQQQQQRTQSLQQQVRNRCSCASHNATSLTHVLDGEDKSVMSICQGGALSKPQGKERDAYRLPTNGECRYAPSASAALFADTKLPSVYPSHYDLIFKTDLEKLVFEGQGIVQ